MATIHRADSPVARCRVCGIQRQFHAKSDVPHSADRDHAFEVEMVADFEPGELTPEQLVGEIVDNTELYEAAAAAEAGREAEHFEDRARLCRIELKSRVRAVMGIDFDDLEGALS